jgi:ubiquinone/menaquinone biosynthesis C-methylase UbiE
MAHEEYGQQPQMEHPTMVGTLEAQIEMIWPLERPILERLGLPLAGMVLDLGCGTGRASGRIAEAWPELEVHGMDLFPGHLEVARRDFPPEKHPNLHFREGDARSTPWPPSTFGAVVIRHVLHAIPDPQFVLREAYRVLQADGLLYVLAEDYQAMLFDAATEESQSLFLDAAPALRRIGTNLFHGRAAQREVLKEGFKNVRVDPIVVDTSNSSRATFARMMRFWRDGYAEVIAKAIGRPVEEVRRRFDGQIFTAMDTERYAGWLLLAVSGRKPSA